MDIPPELILYIFSYANNLGVLRQVCQYWKYLIDTCPEFHKIVEYFGVTFTEHNRPYIDAIKLELRFYTYLWDYSTRKEHLEFVGYNHKLVFYRNDVRFKEGPYLFSIAKRYPDIVDTHRNLSLNFLKRLHKYIGITLLSRKHLLMHNDLLRQQVSMGYWEQLYDYIRIATRFNADGIKMLRVCVSHDIGFLRIKNTGRRFSDARTWKRAVCYDITLIKYAPFGMKCKSVFEYVMRKDPSQFRHLKHQYESVVMMALKHDHQNFQYIEVQKERYCVFLIENHPDKIGWIRNPSSRIVHMLSLHARSA